MTVARSASAAPRLLVFAALGWECRAVVQALRRPRRMRGLGLPLWRGEADRGEVWVIETGVGPRRAAAAAAAVDLAAAAVVVSTGCAGGLAPTLRAGDLVIASAIHADDGLHATDQATREQLLGLASAAGLPMREGPIRCSATMIASRADKQAAAAAGALVVEMEAAPIAEAALRAARPFVSVRAVIDSADDDVTLLARIGDPTSGQVRPLALAAQLLRRPGTVAELRALRQAQVAARASLRRFFSLWFAQTKS